MKKILSVGEDAWLLSSRAAVLRMTGASVTNCSASTLEIYSGIEFDLVILCHTLKGEVKYRVTAEIRQRWPRARVVQLFSGYCYATDSLVVDADVASGEPGKLVEQVIELLKIRPLGQTRKAAQSTFGYRRSA
jgi:CheY-like chemotaxis protein